MIAEDTNYLRSVVAAREEEQGRPRERELLGVPVSMWLFLALVTLPLLIPPYSPHDD